MLIYIFKQVLPLFLPVALPQLVDYLLVAVYLVVEPFVLTDAGAAVDRLPAVGVQVLAALLLLVDLPGVGVVRNEGITVGPTGLRRHRLPQEIV